MSHKIILITALVAFVAACAKKEEIVITEPVSAEPVYTGKYK